MQNGNITKFSIIASGVLGLLIVGFWWFLLYKGVDVPDKFWLMGAAALVGVVGMDVLATLVSKYKV